MIQDAGGVPLAGGGRMRTGMVYRISGALAGPDELAELAAVGLRTVVDLRSEIEDRSAVVDWAQAHGVAYWNYPIIVGGYTGRRDSGMMRAIREGSHVEFMREIYSELAVDFGDQLAGAFARIAEGFPSGFGCAAGKDRTGVMSAYLHVLLGASEETAIESYLARAPSVEALRPALAGLFDLDEEEHLQEGLTHVMSVQAANLEYAFERVRALGGVEAFLTGHGLSARAVEQLREALVEPAA